MEQVQRAFDQASDGPQHTPWTPSHRSHWLVACCGARWPLTLPRVQAHCAVLSHDDRTYSVTLITRRHFVTWGPAIFGGSAALSACSSGTEADGYEAVARQVWRPGALDGLAGAALSKELVRYATLAPSSHNTQCWKFAVVDKAITILPDLSRRTPAVDPDDHHLFVSLGCAAENLVQAALAHGLAGDVRFDAASDAVRVTLAPTPARASPLFKAIPERQCTRGDYDGKPLSNEELRLLESAATADGVRMLLFTERSAME